MLIHPTGFTQPQRFARFYFNNVIGNPLDTTVALHYLIFDGVFERHPKLRVLAVHGGGFLGAYSGRIDHAWGARSDSHGNLPQAADDLSAAERLFRHGRFYAASARGAGEHLSAPTASSWARTIRSTCWNMTRSAMSIRSTSFDDATRAAICGGNAKKLLEL